MNDPITVECIACKAQPGEECDKPGGGVHAVRVAWAMGKTP